MARARTDAVTAAQADVESARQTLAEWAAAKVAAEAELASLESRSGAEVLDDPAAASRLPKVMQELRDRIDIAARAIEAQHPRVKAATSAFLLAQADVYERPVVQARAALVAHEARTAELLAALEEHEGRFVPEALLLSELASHESTKGVAKSWELAKSVLMRDRIAELELPALILREMAAGNDPHPMVARCGRPAAEVYPPCVWGPDALVPAPAYERTTRAMQDELASLRDSVAAQEDLVRSLESEVEELRQRHDREAQTQLRPAREATGDMPPTVADKLASARKRLEIEQARLRTIEESLEPVRSFQPA